MTVHNCLEYYSEHGVITSPGSHRHLLASFSTDISELCECIHRCMLIDLLPTMGVIKVPKEHLNDNNIRVIQDKLEEIVRRDDSSILSLRSKEKLLLGNCRDLSLMMCSVLRNHKIPARLRSGFGTFFVPQKYFDHWVCEYWNKLEKRWIKVDPWMSQIQYRKEMLPPELFDGLLKLNYNPYDVTNEYFITGGQAWINCREYGHNPDDYRTYEDFLKGTWFVRDNMIRDLLCLYKIEPLPWDCWGIMGRENNNINDEELEVLDKLAQFLSDENFTEAHLLEKLKGLQIFDSVMGSLA